MKLLDLDTLIKKIKKEKKKKKKIVLCHGVFDLIHIGHIKHFQSAKKFGDILVVTVTEDKYVNKGPGKPLFNSKLRSEFLSSLEVVDYVAISNNQCASNIIKSIKPDVFCKGHEYKNHSNDVTENIKKELKILKSINGVIKYTNDIVYSSSNLINNHFNLNNKRIQIKNFSMEHLNKMLLKIKKLKVLVIGEVIIDQYQPCIAVGKSGKEPMLIFNKNSEVQNFTGGALAIAQNISNYCSKVKILSYLGENLEYKNYIQSNLSKNVSFEYVKKKNSSTIIKKRYIDASSKNKVFGIYNINDDNFDKSEEDLFLKLLNKNINKYDLVIVSDYSHGLISKKIAKQICKEAKFLSLNAQINSFSIGYHTLKKYKKINLLVINEGELRQEFKDKYSKIKDLIKKLSKLYKIKVIVVTQGKDGAILYGNNKFYDCFGLADKIVDKVGAGDSMLSLMSIFNKISNNHNLNLIIGSLAAADSIKNTSNSSFFDKKKLLKNIMHIIK
jgi:rfaE bifunctional protein kinase chain/domain/rfaE bifunctional protein nucleotidyltransferase chain/domain